MRLLLGVHAQSSHHVPLLNDIHHVACRVIPCHLRLQLCDHERLRVLQLILRRLVRVDHWRLDSDSVVALEPLLSVSGLVVFLAQGKLDRLVVCTFILR